MIRDTSRAAFDTLRSTGTLSRRQREVMLCVFRCFHGRTFTRKQLAAALGWEINRVTGRVQEILRMGYLEEQGTTLEDGRSAHLLAIKAAQLELAIAA